MPRITNGGPERARKQTLGEREGRSCKHRIEPDRPLLYAAACDARCSGAGEAIQPPHLISFSPSANSTYLVQQAKSDFFF